MAKTPKHLRKSSKKTRLILNRFFKQKERPYVPSQDQLEFEKFQEEVNQDIINRVTGVK